VTDFALPPKWKYRLKAATRRLIAKAGGLEDAQLLLGNVRGTTTIQRWGDPSKDEMIPLMAAMALQQEIGEPILTKVMAELQGMAVVPKQPQGGRQGFLLAQQRIAKETADYHAAVTRAMVDGVITEAEKAEIFKEGGDVGEAMADSLNDMATPGVIHVFAKGA
jgi:hypothetical protein